MPIIILSCWSSHSYFSSSVLQVHWLRIATFIYSAHSFIYIYFRRLIHSFILIKYSHLPLHVHVHLICLPLCLAQLWLTQQDPQRSCTHALAAGCPQIQTTATRSDPTLCGNPNLACGGGGGGGGGRASWGGGGCGVPRQDLWISLSSWQ